MFEEYEAFEHRECVCNNLLISIVYRQMTDPDAGKHKALTLVRSHLA